MDRWIDGGMNWQKKGRRGREGKGRKEGVLLPQGRESRFLGLYKREMYERVKSLSFRAQGSSRRRRSVICKSFVGNCLRRGLPCFPDRSQLLGVQDRAFCDMNFAAARVCCFGGTRFPFCSNGGTKENLRTPQILGLPDFETHPVQLLTWHVDECHAGTGDGFRDVHVVSWRSMPPQLQNLRLLKNIFYFPLLVLKGIYQYCFSRGLKQMEEKV